MIVAVVGGAGAIGRAVVMDLHEHGYTPVILDRPETKPDVPIDVRDQRSVAAAFTAMNVTDALVYVSGVQIAGPLYLTEPEEWDELFAVNVRGAYLCIREMLIQHLTEAIVLVASIAGLRSGGPGLTAYSASKGAEIALGRALAVELAPAVRVNVVCPGWTDTLFNAPTVSYMGGRAAQEALVKEAVPLQRQAEPGEIAPAVRFALEATYMTGAAIAVDGGVSLH